MGDFISNPNSTLPGPKQGGGELPPGRDPNKRIRTADFNALREALLDSRSKILTHSTELSDLRTDLAANPAAEVLDERTVLARGSVFARKLADRFVEVFNVKDFGAKGDNTTDDRPAIAAALAAAGAANGGCVFFPPGAYYVASTLEVTQNDVTLVGDGFFGGTYITNKFGAYTTIKVKGPGPNVFNRRIRMRGLRITGGVATYNVVDFGMFDCFVNFGNTHTLLIEGGWSFQFVNCQFQSAMNGHDVYIDADAANTFREVNALDFIACRIEGATKSGIASNPLTKVQVLNIHGGIIEEHSHSTEGWGIDIPYGNNINGSGIYFEGNRSGNVRLGSATTAVSCAAFPGTLNAGYGEPRPKVGFHLVNAHGVDITGRHTGFDGEWLRVEPASTSVNADTGHETLDNFPGGTRAATFLGKSAKSGMDGANLLRNGGFEKWDGMWPLGWSRNAGNEAMAASADRNSGLFSASLTNALGSSGSYFQRISDLQNKFPELRGKRVVVTVLAKTNVANRVRARVGDDVAPFAASGDHPGDDAWHALSAAIVVSDTATKITVNLEITTGDGSVVTALFDDAVLVVGADVSAERGSSIMDQIAAYTGEALTAGAGPTFSVVVTHNLDTSKIRVLVTPRMNAKVWTTNPTSTQVTINSDVAGWVDYMIVQK